MYTWKYGSVAKYSIFKSPVSYRETFYKMDSNGNAISLKIIGEK